MTVKRVGFVLCSNQAQPIPSTRIAALRMLPFLATLGMQPLVLHEPQQPDETPDLTGVAQRVIEQGCDVVVLQKVHGPSAVHLARQLSASGVRTVFLVCDLVDIAMSEATDATVVVTDYLKSLHPVALQSKIHVVHDGIEQPHQCKDDSILLARSEDQHLRAVLVTSASLDRLPVLVRPPAWLRVRIVGQYASGLRRLRQIGWTWRVQPPQRRLDYMRFLVDHRIECVPWGAQRVYREMMLADIGVIPIEVSPANSANGLTDACLLKSENRLTMKMSMGLPVVATAIPSYETVIDQGVNGFLARSRPDWNACLAALRDPGRRREMGLAARASVASRFSTEAQAAELVTVLKTLPSQLSVRQARR
ncbi:glycosyltransferase [Rhodoferax sp.]|uniref:glycosyltransferase family protein n=1 Tax=Rhodoferax sp. TaxID=50421 RepID=UPI00274A0E57|nr:glycosyltransferase [Rhodoferax sp.]